MSGDILQTPDAPKPQGALDNYFKITARGSTVRQDYGPICQWRLVARFP